MEKLYKSMDKCLDDGSVKAEDLLRAHIKIVRTVLELPWSWDRLERKMHHSLFGMLMHCPPTHPPSSPPNPPSPPLTAIHKNREIFANLPPGELLPFVHAFTLVYERKLRSLHEHMRSKGGVKGDAGAGDDGRRAGGEPLMQCVEVVHRALQALETSHDVLRDMPAIPPPPAGAADDDDHSRAGSPDASDAGAASEDADDDVADESALAGWRRAARSLPRPSVRFLLLAHVEMGVLGACCATPRILEYMLSHLLPVLEDFRAARREQQADNPHLDTGISMLEVGVAQCYLCMYEYRSSHQKLCKRVHCAGAALLQCPGVHKHSRSMNKTSRLKKMRIGDVQRVYAFALGEAQRGEGGLAADERTRKYFHYIERSFCGALQFRADKTDYIKQGQAIDHERVIQPMLSDTKPVPVARLPTLVHTAGREPLLDSAFGIFATAEVRSRVGEGGSIHLLIGPFVLVFGPWESSLNKRALTTTRKR